ncbi:hypothetical protein [Photobacterium sanguinicancri]|uniref:hypothetical protein n=1 Tax=Photobacterium sanguinicancri TaxID=875932 RepID=UPI0026E2782C|nr:hypothetical protein [Photobacterium sanguinicancri]MDO6497326.1 hypothetical protein [Photobacterium sanguinicancri]
MARKERKKIIAYAVESTYGVDAIAGGSPKYVLGREFSVTPMAGESQSLDYDDGTLGNSAEVMTEKYVTLEFTVDLAASNDVKVAAPFGDLMSGCLRQANAVATECTYSFDDNSTGSLTFYFYQSGTLHKVTGARGSLSFSGQAKNFGGIKFAFTGLFQPVSGQTLPVPDFTPWRTPLKIGVENSAFSIDGKALKLISIEYDQANSVTYQEYVGHEEVQITDYKPTATIVIEAPEHADWNPWLLAEQGGTHTVVFSNGPVTNQIEWKSSKVQLGRPTYGEQEGTQTYSIPLNVIKFHDVFTTR